MRAKRGAAFLLGLLAFTRAIYSQTQHEAEAYKLHVEARLATADVAVRDTRSKTPVEGLSGANFRVFDNDREQPITHFSVVSEDTRPLAIVLLLDLWWGYGKHVAEVLPAAAQKVVAQFRPGDKLALVTWQILHRECVPTVDLALDFTSDSQAVAAKLQELVQIHDRHLADMDRCDAATARDFRKKVTEAYPKGQADGVRLASKSLLQLDGYRHEIIDFDHDYADAPKAESTEQARTLAQALIGFNLIRDPVFMLDVTRPFYIAQSAANQTQDRVLNFYVEETGGTVLSPSARKYGEALEQIILGIRSSYSLGWKVPQADGELHRIRVQLVGRGETQIKVRKTYLAPKSLEPSITAK